MPTSTQDIRTEYPLPVYNYRVEIGPDAVAFSEVSGLNIAYETTTFKESPVAGGAPGPRVMYMPGQATMTRLTLKKGVVRKASIRAWFGDDMHSTTEFDLTDSRSG